MHLNKWLAVGAAGILSIGVAACGDNGSDSDSGSSDTGATSAKVSGPVSVDGSSTVFPFAQAAAEGFQGENPDVKITVGESGTGGGFEKFCAGETDIANASRPIDEEEEVPTCEKNKVVYGDVQVANDGIAIVTNKELDLKCLTVDQLKALWSDGSKVATYKDLDPSFPDTKVSLYGPGTDSGTFDFFTEEINGEKGNTRKDYQPSEDDNVLVQGVSGDKAGLGYFGFSYYEANADKLNLVQVDGGDGCKAPSKEDIQTATYKPLSRPLFMYTSQAAIAKPQVKSFLDYTVANSQEIAETAQIVPLTPEQETEAKAALTKIESGS